MKVIIFEIKDAVRNMLKSFFSSDLDVMSDEVRTILSNPVDAQKYKDAVKDIEEGRKTSVTIELSNKREITLVQ